MESNFFNEYLKQNKRDNPDNICDCGGHYKYYNKSIHEKTKKHLNFKNQRLNTFKELMLTDELYKLTGDIHKITAEINKMKSDIDQLVKMNFNIQKKLNVN